MKRKFWLPAILLVGIFTIIGCPSPHNAQTPIEYTISIDSAEGAKVNLGQTEAASGTDVIFTVTVEDRYEIISIIVDNIPLKLNDKNEYSFKMPEKDVKITVVTSKTVNPDDPNVNPDDPNVNPDDSDVNPDDPNVNPDDPDVNPDDPNVNPDDPDVNPDDPNVNPDDPDVNPDKPIRPSLTGIKFKQDTIYLWGGEEFELEVVYEPENAYIDGSYELTSDNSDVLLEKIMDQNIVKTSNYAKYEGTVITATYTDSNNNTFKAECIVYVCQKVQELKFAKTELTLLSNATYSIPLSRLSEGTDFDTIQYRNPVEVFYNIPDGISNALMKEVIWTSSDPTVATIKDGVIKTLKEGTTTINCIIDGLESKNKCVLTVSGEGGSLDAIIK